MGTINKAILLCASIGWQMIYDEKGRPKARHIGVSVSWMPYKISCKRCGFNHHIPVEYASLMQREPQRIEMMVDHIARCFARAAAKLMEQNHADPSDMSEACEELMRWLPDGFRSFLENDKIWIHHFNHVLNVPKGSLYRTEDDEWYEADEDAMIVVRCGAGEQMMTGYDPADIISQMKPKED